MVKDFSSPFVPSVLIKLNLGYSRFILTTGFLSTTGEEIQQNAYFVIRNLKEI